MALVNENTNLKSLIHHSDRGLQYCSKNYQKLLNQNNIMLSMTEQYDPNENTIVERINGILKQEFDKYNVDIETKSKQTKNAIEIYN